MLPTSVPAPQAELVAPIPGSPTRRNLFVGSPPTATGHCGRRPAATWLVQAAHERHVVPTGYVHCSRSVSDVLLIVVPSRSSASRSARPSPEVTMNCWLPHVQGSWRRLATRAEAYTKSPSVVT